MRPLPTVLQIVEVLGRSEQGLSQPYLCRADDGALYYVKGQQTDRASLWKEWIAGHLALAIGLPIPPFSLMQVDPVLLAELPADWRSIGETTAFGSRKHPSVSWFEASLVERVPEADRQAVIVFDWWVRNSDRLSGNTNLLWDADEGKMVVIDHNQAFDPAFDPDEFCQDHVFAFEWQAVRTDLFLQTYWQGRLTDTLPIARWACDNAPPEWRWANVEMDVPANFDPEIWLTHLARCGSPDLWRIG